MLLQLLACLLIAPQGGTVEDPPEVVADIAFIEPTRADLALCLGDFERALRLHDASDDPLAQQTALRIARGFDAGTMAFFLGDGAGALRAMRGLQQSLIEVDAATKLAGSLRVRIEPPVVALAVARTARVSWAPFFAAPDATLAPALEFTLQGPLPDQRVVARWSVSSSELRSAGAREFGLDEQLVSGRYALVLGTARCATWNVLDRPIAELRQELAARLQALPAADALAAARFCAGERIKLLVERPNETRSAEFLADLPALAAALALELSALEAGRDPYRRRVGDTWRARPRGSLLLPFRVHAPPAACGETPVPLVIALHGAGGDENMFFESYDLGRLRELSAQRGFLLAAPLNVFGGRRGAELLGELIDQLCADYAVDRRRICVLGHSMGAQAAAGLAASAADRLAGVVCLAGGSFAKSGATAPVLAIAADADGVSGWRGVESSAKRALAAGLPVEFRLLANLGHLTMVGPALPPAVDWMLARRLAD